MPTAKQRTLSRLKARRKPALPQGPPGWGGTGWASGPIWIDAFQSRRAPTPVELVEGFKSVVWACSQLNQSGVARTRLGLYATTSEGQVKPKRWSCPTRTVRPIVKAMIRKTGARNQCEGWIQKQATAAEVDEVMEHPLLEAFHTVNDDWDHDLLIRYCTACLDICGWFFLLPEATGASVSGRSVPDLIWPLLAQYMLPFRASGGSLVEYYRYFTAIYQPEELIRGRCVSLRDPYGLGYGPAQAAWAYIGLNDQFTSIQENLMTQGGRISGYISDADPANPAGKSEGERAEQRINASWTRGNSGRIPYLPGAFKFNPTAWPPRDLAELQISDNALQRIANCFGAPISLLKTEDVNRANADAGHLQHSKLAIDPRCHLIASSLTKWTRRYGDEHNLPGWERLFWAFDNPVTEDAEQNSRVFTAYIDKRVFTPNEVRTELGYEPYDGGDEVLVAGTLKTVDQITNPPPPPPQLAPFTGGNPSLVKDEEDGQETGLEGEKSLPFGRGRASGTEHKDMSDRDLPEAGGHGEKNIYGLPQGESIRDALIRWFNRQRLAVLGNLPTLGAPLPAAIPAVTDWDDPMARAMTPMLGVYWDEAGKATRERLGLDPDEWRVTNPHLKEKIHTASLNFCQSTNASTSRRLDDALHALRGELARGMVEEGEGVRELTKRVNGIFEGLTKSHARMIAASEASRAVHAAQETAAVDSGVVAGFELLLSSDACPLCRKIHDECKSVPVGQAFAVIGDHPDYSTIKHPPLHPACQCTMVEVLLPEFGGPVDPQWGQTLEQPQAELDHEHAEKPKAEPKPAQDPVKQAMLTDRKYTEESGEKDYRGRPLNGYQLYTFGDLSPDDFDPDAELKIVKAASSHIRDTLEKHPDFVKAIDEDGARMVEYKGRGINASVYFADDPERVGWGVGGDGGFKYYPAPYTLKDKNKIPEHLRSFGVDPVYVLIHESHHAYGSHSEFDAFSDAVALDFHLGRGNDLNPKAVDDLLWRHVSASMWKARGGLKDVVKDARMIVKFLYEKHPEKIAKVAKELYGDSVDIAAQVRKWK